MAETNKYNFLVCSDCESSGYQDGKPCPKCHGLGVALHLQDRVLYWGKYYDFLNISYDKITKRVRMFINLLIGLFVLSGIFVMGWLGFQDNFNSFINLDYWLAPSFEKLYFWLTLLAALYLYYRLDQETSSKFNVMTKVFQEKPVDNPAGMDWDSIWQLNKSKRIDISESFTEESRKAVQAAWELAKHFDHHEVLRIHLLGVLPQFNKSGIIFARLGINFENLKTKVSRYLSKKIIARPGNPLLTAEIHKLLLVAYLEAYNKNLQKVSLPEIVWALASPAVTQAEKDDIEDILIDFEVTYQKMINVVVWISIQEQLRNNWQRFQGRARFKPKTGMDRAMTAVATPLLDRFSEDLTLQAKYGQFFPCIGRQDEFDKLYRIMEGSRQGVLLVGNNGVGRTTILQGLAQRMASEDVPEILQDKRLVSLNVASLLAGADAAAAEQRLMMIINEVIHSGNIVMAVENIQNLQGISAGGGEHSLDLSEVFSQLMSKHLFNVVATTTPDGYVDTIENKSLDGAFQNIKIDELQLNEAIQVLEAKSGPIEYKNGVYFSYNAISKAAELSSRYIHDRYLPEKAIEILEQVAIKVQKAGTAKVVRGEDVAEVVSEMTKIPLTQVTAKESEKLLNLEDKIHERMVDQVEAVDIVAASLRRARAELREGTRPISSMLFLGPTGVGKTELAKTVADVYFGSEETMIRIDMSEYQEQSSIGRLIGQNNSTGQLTEAVRKNPFALLLFDEIEKAHPDILNLFLQVLDDGRLTDSQGRTIDFTNTIIIMTSNAGAQYIQDEINKGTSVDVIKDYLINEELKQHYRPEFLNRFDGVVVFKPLSMVDVIQIAKLLTKKIAKKLDEKGIIFEITDEAVAELAELGFDPKFGARPLRRVVQEKIDDALAKKLLEGQIARRDKVIYEVGGNLKIVKAKEL
jgi:ATP-dependent Clp protease ATP-binding subunit ClpC